MNHIVVNGSTKFGTAGWSCTSSFLATSSCCLDPVGVNEFWSCAADSRYLLSVNAAVNLNVFRATDTPEFKSRCIIVTIFTVVFNLFIVVLFFPHMFKINLSFVQTTLDNIFFESKSKQQANARVVGGTQPVTFKLLCSSPSFSSSAKIKHENQPNDLTRFLMCFTNLQFCGFVPHSGLSVPFPN